MTKSIIIIIIKYAMLYVNLKSYHMS